MFFIISSTVLETIVLYPIQYYPKKNGRGHARTSKCKVHYAPKYCKIGASLIFIVPFVYYAAHAQFMSNLRMEDNSNIFIPSSKHLIVGATILLGLIAYLVQIAYRMQEIGLYSSNLYLLATILGVLASLVCLISGWFWLELIVVNLIQTWELHDLDDGYIF